MTVRIVVCDDEPCVTRAVSMKLSRAGFDVETAGDGALALEAIRREVPALLICDCQMPRLGGVELCRQLRADPATIQLPIILLTAKSYEIDPEALMRELSILHVIAKPFSPRELLKVVQQAIGLSAAEQP